MRAQNGYVALAVTLLTMIISLIVIGGFTFFAIQETRTTTAFTKSIESRAIAEGGIEDMVYRIVSGKQYSASETLDVGNGTTTLTVSTSGTQKTVRSEGKRNNFQQNLQTKVTAITTAASFYYGVQIGDGGLTMGNGSQVNGNVYSNGNVTGSGTVTGDAFVAGGINATSSYSWEQNDADQEFATSSASRDVAQSFIATSTGPLNKVSVLIKKVGSPGPTNGLTLHIASDNGGQPNNTDLANATISNSSVGASLSWIDVSFASPASMTTGSKYWIVLDYGTNSTTNYWVWRKDTSDAYASNTGAYASTRTSGTWTPISADLDFKVWIGGVNTKIDGITIGNTASGTGHANLFVNATVHGSACPNQYCIVENPARRDFAISDGVVQNFRDEAAAGGTVGNQNISGTVSMGPKKINGDLNVSNGATLIVTGTLWVTGQFQPSNNAIIRLDSSYGANSGVIVGDNNISISNGVALSGSGQAGSYLMIVAGKNAPSGQVLDISNNAVGAIFYAPHGRIHFNNNASAKEATGYGIDLDNNATVTYESGLANMNFSSGPSGGYSVDAWQQVP